MLATVMQAAPRDWAPQAVHDTVRAVLETAPFRRSLQQSLLERLLLWLSELVQRLARYFESSASARTMAITLAAMLAMAVVARVILAARARDGLGSSTAGRHREARDADPWLAAEHLASAGRYEEAAHAVYRGVLHSLAASERMRLDASFTSGDYARALRTRGSAALVPFRAFSRRFDVAAYGHGECDARLVSDLLALAQPFRARARAA